MYSAPYLLSLVLTGPLTEPPSGARASSIVDRIDDLPLLLGYGFMILSFYLTSLMQSAVS